MKVQITARHLKLTPAIREYLTKKVERLERHFDHLVWASAILLVEKRRHIAEVVIHSPLHTMRSEAHAEDLYAAIDLVVDKMDKQIKKVKEKWKKLHRPRESRSERASFEKRAFDFDLTNGEGSSQAPSRVGLPYSISVVKQVNAKAETIEDALETMESLGYNFWLFLNKDTKKYNVVFRRSDQTYGLLEPYQK